jgi:putative serine protease PepD
VSVRSLAAALAVAAVVGGAAGAGVYAVAGGDGGTTTTVREVATTTTAAATASTVTPAGGLDVGKVYADSSPGVVEIAVTGVDDSPFGNGTQQSQGTGFVVDEQGHVVTNQHVVGGATAIRVTFADGSTYRATVVGQDASTDIAVVKVAAPAAELHPLAFGDSSAVAVGQAVVAIGSPFGLQNTVTTGIVSAVGREITSPDRTPIENVIQTDAAVNHGNSGGPLLDLRGRVIGVTSQIESSSGGSDGVGFAVPSNTVESVVSQLVSRGRARHALLGVQVQTLPPNVARTLGVPAGVAVAAVDSGSAADKAGLKEATSSRTIAGVDYSTGGDVITKIDGDVVTTAEQLRGAIAAHVPGDVVELTAVRGGRTRIVRATLGSR